MTAAGVLIILAVFPGSPELRRSRPPQRWLPKIGTRTIHTRGHCCGWQPSPAPATFLVHVDPVRWTHKSRTGQVRSPSYLGGGELCARESVRIWRATVASTLCISFPVKSLQ